MGMFDNVRVDATVIPPWSPAMPRSAYNAEVTELTSEYGSQTKDLFLTLDSYEITASGHLIRTTDSWRDQEHRLTPEEIRQLESALPVNDRPGCWHVASFSGTLCPCNRIEFAFEAGRLLSASIRALDEEEQRHTKSKYQCKLDRAEDRARHNGLNTRKGKKWVHARKRLARRRKTKILVIDEAGLYMSEGVSEAFASMIRAGRKIHIFSQSMTDLSGRNIDKEKVTPTKDSVDPVVPDHLKYAEKLTLTAEGKITLTPLP